jgi:hypothetical protein
MATHHYAWEIAVLPLLMSPAVNLQLPQSATTIHQYRNEYAAFKGLLYDRTFFRILMSHLRSERNVMMMCNGNFSPRHEIGLWFGGF